MLAAQRGSPAHLAGLWEFPGGKVEPGESEDQALLRECREELGVELVVGERVGPDVAVPDRDLVLRVWLARIAAGAVPEPTEHLAVRWLSAEQLYDVPWIPADLPIVAALALVLGRVD